MLGSESSSDYMCGVLPRRPGWAARQNSTAVELVPRGVTVANLVSEEHLLDGRGDWIVDVLRIDA